MIVCDVCFGVSVRLGCSERKLCPTGLVRFEVVVVGSDG